MQISIMQKRTGTLVNLQICRFLAAISVVMVHVQLEAIKSHIGTPSNIAASQSFPWGFGVDIFFIISGFMMIHASRRYSGGVVDAVDFFKRRLFRVTPLYWIFTALTVALLMVKASTRADLALYHVVSSLFYIPLISPAGRINPVLSIGWTINYEMFFYVVFSLTLLLPTRYGRPALFAALLALMALGFAIGDGVGPVYFWTRPILLEFVFGCVTALAFHKGLSLHPVVALLCVVIGAALLFVSSAYGIAEGQAYRWWSLGIPAALIVVGITFTKQLSDAGIAKRFHQLGDASFSLYLAHPFVVLACSMAWTKAGLHSFWAFAALSLIASTAASIVVWRVIEMPIRRALAIPPREAAS